jgi:hypothetical protein
MSEVEKIADTLSAPAADAVRSSTKMVSGGTRVSFMTAQPVWKELEDAGLLTERKTACITSSYLSNLGLQVRAHLQPKDPAR